MALSDALKAEVRRHLKYPAIGTPGVNPGLGYSGSPAQGGSFQGFRFFQAYGLLEFRMNNLSASEETALLGNASAYFPTFASAAGLQINLAGTIVSGDTIAAQINGIAASYTTINTDTLTTAAVGLAAAVNASPVLAGVVQASATGAVVVLKSRAFGYLANSLTCQVFNGTSITGTVSVVGTPATLTNYFQGGADPPGPVWTDPTQQVTMPYWGYIPIIRYHESQLPNALSGQDTVQAAVFHQRQDEQAARMGSYSLWCKRMAQFIGIPYNAAGNYDQQGPARRVV